MKNILIIVFFCCLVAYSTQAQIPRDSLDPTVTEVWEPIPPKVTPGEKGAPPSDAIVLFDGKDLSNFVSEDGTPAKWDVKDGYMTVNVNAPGIKTKQNFDDCQLHVEWRSPIEDTDEGQGKGNSGVWFMDKYEIQVLDSYENRTYSNGQASAVYKQHAPLVNASKKPGEWQTYDIIFTAPRFSDKGTLITPARVTVLHNGVLVQNNVSILGPVEYRGLPVYVRHEAKAPLKLQEHTDLVSFRNIWIREL